MAVDVVAVMGSVVVVVVCEALEKCSSHTVLQGSAESVVVPCMGQLPAFRILALAMVNLSAVVLRNLTAVAAVPKR